MIISHKHKFIFFAIPKTGTHAIRFALRDHLGEQDEEQVNLYVKRRLSDETLSKTKHGHLSCQQVQSVLDKSTWESYFKFAFVRNPYDRFISYCFFMNRQNKAFQKNPLPTMKEIFNNQRNKENILFRPQSDLLCDPSGNLLLDFVGKYENFQSDFEKICAQIGVPSQTLEHVNASVHNDWQQYYDAELRAMIGSHFARDFEAFDYQASAVVVGTVL